MGKRKYNLQLGTEAYKSNTEIHKSTTFPFLDKGLCELSRSHKTFMADEDFIPRTSK